MGREESSPDSTDDEREAADIRAMVGATLLAEALHELTMIRKAFTKTTDG